MNPMDGMDGMAPMDVTPLDPASRSSPIGQAVRIRCDASQVNKVSMVNKVNGVTTNAGVNEAKEVGKVHSATPALGFAS